MKFLIFGAGALGSVFAGLLARKKHIVYCIDRKKIVQSINKNGLHITGIWGNFFVNKNITCFENVKQFPETDFDCIFISVKSFDTENAAKEIKKIRNPNTPLVSLQNGIFNIETLQKILLKNIIGGRVIFGAQKLSLNKVKVTVYAEEVRLGFPKNEKVDNKFLKTICKLLTDSGIPTLPASCIEKYIYAKLLYNCALNPLGAILKETYGNLLKYEHTRNIMEHIIREIFLTAKENRIPLFWKNYKSYKKILFKKLIPATAEHRSSMLQDILNKRKTEIDSLSGAVVKLAKMKNISVPYNEIMFRVIKTMEQQNIK